MNLYALIVGTLNFRFGTHGILRVAAEWSEKEVSGSVFDVASEPALYFSVMNVGKNSGCRMLETDSLK